MLIPRKLYRRRQQKEKLYGALRELYADGVRVYTGRPDAREILRRHVERRTPARATAHTQPILIVPHDHDGVDPYNTTK